LVKISASFAAGSSVEWVHNSPYEQPKNIGLRLFFL
jgi:hypothetical protein